LVQLRYLVPSTLPAENEAQNELRKGS
jgi:hypothetical protein